MLAILALKLRNSSLEDKVQAFSFTNNFNEVFSILVSEPGQFVGFVVIVDFIKVEVNEKSFHKHGFKLFSLGNVRDDH